MAVRQLFFTTLPFRSFTDARLGQRALIAFCNCSGVRAHLWFATLARRAFIAFEINCFSVMARPPWQRTSKEAIRKTTDMHYARKDLHTQPPSLYRPPSPTTGANQNIMTTPETKWTPEKINARAESLLAIARSREGEFPFVLTEAAHMLKDQAAEIAAMREALRYYAEGGTAQRVASDALSGGAQ